MLWRGGLVAKYANIYKFIFIQIQIYVYTNTKYTCTNLQFETLQMRRQGWSGKYANIYKFPLCY